MSIMPVWLTLVQIQLYDFSRIQYSDQALVPTLTAALAKHSRPRCVAISPDCAHIAVGVQSPPDMSQSAMAEVYIYTTQLESSDPLQCLFSSDIEPPKNLKFSDDSNVLLCSGELNYCAWTRFTSKWRRIDLGQVNPQVLLL